jgi:NAD(P)-dependent dehydrogenase (short-subunit alcohol dehydrogenase family)
MAHVSSHARLADLTGRAAVVVGASRGIGRSIAEALAREGADVIAVARDAGRLEAVAASVRALGRRCETLAVDVADAEALVSGLDAVAARGLVPTILVHAAAAMYRHQRLQFVEQAELDRMHAIDVRSAIVACRWVLPHMVGERFGRIVLLGSLAAHTGIPGATAYATSKAALEGLARGLALDYSQRGITANVLALGFVETERLAERLEGEPGARDRLVEATATKRVITPEEVAAATLFLCSEHARSITGAVVDVTAGSHLATRF